jgi:zinc metalloprotease ZmpB
MTFQLTPNVTVTRDSSGAVRQLSHIQQPFRPAGLRPGGPRALARSYLTEVAPIYSIAAGLLDTADEPPGETITADGLQLRYADQSSLLEMTLVGYAQTHWSLPIWEAGLSIAVLGQPQRVTSSRSTLHLDPTFHQPSKRPKFLPAAVTGKGLAELLGVGDERVRISGSRLRVYRFDPDYRFDPESGGPQVQVRGGRGTKSGAAASGRSLLNQGPPVLPLPGVPEAIRAGTHYAVTEVLFALASTAERTLNWRAFLDVDSGAVLYLRALVAGAFANVFGQDPITLTGDTTKTACSGDTALDLLTTAVVLPRLTAANPQTLTGTYVHLQDVDAPNTVPPAAANPPGDFTGVASGNVFAATNAYYHVDFLYDLMRQFGFDVATYHSGTSFPVPVDQSDYLHGQVNAFCAGNATGTGTGEFAFGTVDTCATTPGMAASFRVVMHEFCHNLLWNRVHSPNFGFAHSAGDSIAAILSDPGSLAPDRFQTFPWVAIVADRRHDRDLASGWAWGGSNDTGGYSSEQILSTTHFRLYRSMGGDDTDVSVKTAAAHRIVYLIMAGIASLGPSPITPTPTPDPWVTALMNADTATVSFEDVPGGTAHKVVRWAFEQQGLFQPAGAATPVTTPGAPPDVDVYIDDGRGGQYPYQPVFWENTDIWNRLAADAGTTHQTPIVGVPNFGYVQIKNRGTQPASGAVVSGYHCRPSAGLTWPDDWQAMTTASVAVPGSIAAGGSVIVGPFEWTPSEIGHECMMMSVSADGDLSNIDPSGALPCAAGPTPDEQLARFDNNIGQRNVAPVAGGGGIGGLVASFTGRQFWVGNPYNREIRVDLDVALPPLLSDRGWRAVLRSPGGAAFTLPPRGSRRVEIGLAAGADFTPDDIQAAGDRTGIVVSAKTGGYVFGGITYRIDPLLAGPAPEVPQPGPGHKGCTGAAHRLLECLDLPCGEVRSVRVKKVTVDIELGDCGC